MRIAIVCWEFAGAQRPRSVAEGLVAEGHEVVYITSEPADVDVPFRVVTIPFTRASHRLRATVGVSEETNVAKAARERGRVAAKVVGFAARSFEVLTQFPDKYRNWIPAVRAWLRENPEAFAGVDVVVASTPPASALIVGEMVSASASAPLVFDFRDLWTDNPSYPYRGVRKAVDRATERRLIGSACGATTATRSFAAALSARYPDLTVRAVYTGVDPAPWVGLPSREPDGRLVFAHFGVWYPRRRTIRPLLASLRRLANSGRLDLDRVDVELYGNGADDQTWDAAREFGMTSVVHDRGWLDQWQVPARLAQVDVALLLAWPEDTVSVPLKIHGYVASGKPIMVIGASRESEMVGILADVPGVEVVQSDEEMDAAVAGYWDAAQRGAPLLWPGRRVPVSRASMVREVLELLERCTTSRDS